MTEMPGTLRLDEIPAGSCATVVEVDSRMESERLKAMGVCLGRTLELIKPGDPLILKVFGSRIGMSSRLARHVTVQLCPSSLRCWERESRTEPPPA